MENYKILVVDDNIDNLVITSRLLKKEGYEVMTVSSGLECIKEVKSFKPDLILLDVLLPDISGFEVCRIIKSDQETKDIVIIYYTSVDRSPEVKAEGYRQGADGYIARPISNNEFLSILQAYFRILKKARQIKDSEARWGILSDLSFDGIVIHDKQKVIDANKVMLNMMGYSSIDEVNEASSILDFVAPDSREIVSQKMEQDFEGTFTANLVRKDGSIFPADLSVKNVLIDGKIARAVTVRDITERFLLEREIKRAMEDAIEASRMKSQFVANVSHEIRTPINSLQTIIELVRDTPLTKEQVYYLDLAQKSINCLLDIVNDILDLSKIEAGKIDLKDEDFDFLGLINDLTKMFEHQIKSKGLEMRLEIDQDVPQYLKGDSMRLKQILMNLINNAIKFTDNGYVSLLIRPHKRVEFGRCVLLFVVSDTGRGISQERQERIFESFVQEDGTISRRYGGTGLGLTISKNLVNLMGGTIWVESELGQGSSFYFTVPFNIGNKPDPEEKGEIDSADLFNNFKNMKILLAEDNEINKELTKRLLEKNGFIVEAVSNGIEVLQKLQEYDDFDVILMDMQMPEMDGIMTTQIIKGIKDEQRWKIKRRDIPIIALTANAMKEHRELCISKGMDEYIPKPINIKHMLFILKKILSKKNKSEGELKTLNNTQDKNPPTLINREKALDLLGGDEEMLSQIYDMFLDYVPTQIETLNTALKQKDMESLNRVSHSLKSNAGTIGSEELRQKAYQMEISAKQNDLEAFERHYAEFSALLKAVIEEIHKFKKDKGH
ncbi:MAG: response regulator [Thermodesulfovibrionales bacterium]